MKQTSRPAVVVKAGAIEATAWLNDGEFGQYHTVTITRSYRNHAKLWQRTSQFRQQDLPHVGTVVKQMQDELASITGETPSYPAAINAAIMKNDGPYGPYFTTEIQRFYNGKDGTKQLAKGFRAQDLPVVSDLVAGLATKLRLLAEDPSQLRLPKTTPISDIGLPQDEDDEDDIFNERFSEDALRYYEQAAIA